MKFSEEHEDQQFVITGYNKDSVQINETDFQHGLIITADYFNPDWQPQAFTDLQPQHLDALFEAQPEIILLGTGVKQIVPKKSVYLRLIRSSIGFELMNTQAACRTFNILTADNRKVAAALFCH